MRTDIQEDEMTSVNAKHEALLDELLKDYTDPKDILGEHGLLKQLTKRVVERVLEAELTAHLGYAPHARHKTEDQNARNGKSTKTVQTDTGPLPLEVPRDRKGRFVPRLIPKREVVKISVELFSHLHPLSKQNHELVQGRFPLANGLRPLFGDVLEPHIQ